LFSLDREDEEALLNEEERSELEECKSLDRDLRREDERWEETGEVEVYLALLALVLGRETERVIGPL
jgi:hypothetical protein